MENTKKSKTTSKNSNIPKGEIGIKKKNDYSKLIPLHISAAKQAYFLPEQSRKNTIYINDLETLNESSITNNLECLSNRDMQSFGDSMSLVHSRQGSKTDLFEDKNKKINLTKYQDEFIKKEKEIILLKKEINELQNNNNKLKEQESLNQTLILKLNENYNNLEQILNNIKKEFSEKEKELLQQIEQLKNDIKNKDITINTLQDQSNFNKNIIDNLNKVIKEKDVKINELKKTIKKHQKYLKSNVDINITNNINSNNNCTFSSNNKENENLNHFKNTKTNKNHPIHNKVNLKEFMRKYNLINQNLSHNTDSNNKKTLQSQNKNEFTYHDQGPPKQIKNYNYIEEAIASIPKKSVKDTSLKKQLQLSNKMIKNKKERNRNNVCYSLKSLSNFQFERNGLNKYSNMSHSSFTNKMKDFEQSTFNKKKITYNYSNNNLTKNKKSKDVFLKRLYKYNKRIIKTSISESTNSYLYSDNDNSNNYYNQKINNDKNYDFLKKNSTANNILREHFYRSSLKNIFSMSKKSRKSIEDTPQNRRKLNNQINDYENKKNTDSFLNDIFSDNEKNFNCIKGQNKFKKPNFFFNNSMIDNMNFTSNKNSHSLKLSVRNTKTRDNHIL